MQSAWRAVYENAVLCLYRNRQFVMDRTSVSAGIKGSESSLYAPPIKRFKRLSRWDRFHFSGPYLGFARPRYPVYQSSSSEAPRPQGGASRKGSFIYIVPLDPAYKAGLAGHVPVKADNYPRYHHPEVTLGDMLEQAKTDKG